MTSSSQATENLILDTAPLGFPWPTLDPFLFCVHHDDAYPRGNAQFGPATSLAGRRLGMDFDVKDGFRMYHGQVVPGFPQHPHRGFETVTIARRGYIDHSDSLGAAARFGMGDVQWLTAGAGIVHSEMFPLLHADRDNPVELFQLWLNLPAADKMAPPHFSMLWDTAVPRVERVSENGARALVRVVAGAFGEVAPPTPPPRSWASTASVTIWTLRLEPHASLTLPPAQSAEEHRTLYFFAGDRLSVAGNHFEEHLAIAVRADVELTLEGGSQVVEVLVLGGVPIGEPVAQQGPFVMNTRAELAQTFQDYQRTRFGGWPWERDDPVHGSEPRRFARHADGRVEQAPE